MKPKKSLYFAFPYAKASLDVSLWEGSEKDGRQLPPTVSMRIRKDENTATAIYCKVGDALKIAAALQAYALAALEEDSQRKQAAAQIAKAQATQPQEPQA
ncbi:MAG: hypothetical protein V1708_00975 [Candidatus Micrarchaeota archaeon]